MLLLIGALLLVISGALLPALRLTEAMSTSLGGRPHQVAGLGRGGKGEGDCQGRGEKQKSEKRQLRKLEF